MSFNMYIYLFLYKLVLGLESHHLSCIIINKTNNCYILYYYYYYYYYCYLLVTRDLST